MVSILYYYLVEANLVDFFNAILSLWDKNFQKDLAIFNICDAPSKNRAEYFQYCANYRIIICVVPFLSEKIWQCCFHPSSHANSTCQNKRPLKKRDIAYFNYAINLPINLVSLIFVFLSVSEAVAEIGLWMNRLFLALLVEIESVTSARKSCYTLLSKPQIFYQKL